MITATNTDALAKQLEELSKEVERKLKNMVSEFTVDVVSAAVNNTPLGDSEKFANLYAMRLTNGSGLMDQEGLAQGSWQVALDGSLEFKPDYGFDAGLNAIAETKFAMEGYKLGQDYVIGNTGPYIDELENNYSDQTNGQGIMQPTIEQIQSAIQSDLKQYYDAG